MAADYDCMIEARQVTPLQFTAAKIMDPTIRAQLAKWGRGRIGVETVRDLSQETLAALSDSIDRYDPARGARFSTMWAVISGMSVIRGMRYVS